MEESGHYYTVYFTSLAVGFSSGIASRQATLAQMPDQIKDLDAATLHRRNCFLLLAQGALNSRLAKLNEWRFLVEYVLHSLPDNKTGNTRSADHSDVTRKLLFCNRPDSLEFGLLLHRLGDTYAHRIMHNTARLYGTSRYMYDSCMLENMGHARDGNKPDYPFERDDIFFDYLGELYNVLEDKIRDRGSLLYRRNLGQGKILSRTDLISVFRDMLNNLTEDVSWYKKFFSSASQAVFIQRIREQCQRSFGITMSAYAPEKEGTITFDEYLRTHQDLGIDGYKIWEAINMIKLGLEINIP